MNTKKRGVPRRHMVIVEITDMDGNRAPKTMVTLVKWMLDKGYQQIGHFPTVGRVARIIAKDPMRVRIGQQNARRAERKLIHDTQT